MDRRTDADDATFRKAFAEIIRRYGPAFKALADHDSGMQTDGAPIEPGLGDPAGSTTPRGGS